MIKENFEIIIQDYLQGTSTTCEFYNTSNQELHIIVRPVLDRKPLMQLIGECDRQRLECYVSAVDDGAVLFVALKAKKL